MVKLFDFNGHTPLVEFEVTILKHSKRDAGRVKCGLGVITEKTWMVRVFQYGIPY